MNTQSETFKTMKRFTDAVDAFHVMLEAIARDGNRYTDNVAALVEYAPAVIDGLWGVRKLHPFAASEEETADIGMLSFPSALAERLEKDGDVQGAADQRDVLDRLRVHVARRIVEARKGEVETPLERQLKASVVKNDLERVAGQPLRTFPSDHDLKARPFGDAVPMNGKAGA